MDAPRFPQTYRVGRWQIDARAGALRCGDEVVRIDDRALRVLGRLAQTPGELVSVDTLLDAAWPDVVVSPDSVYQAVATLRRVLEPAPDEPAYIVTVPRRGYRLAAEVVLDERRPAEPAPPPVRDVAAAEVPAAAQVARATPPSKLGPVLMLLATALLVAGVGTALVMERLSKSGAAESAHALPVASTPAGAASGIDTAPPRSVAVLPFGDLTDAMDKEPFADGAVEQIVQSLDKLPGAHVASRTDSAAVPEGRSVAETARRLHVRWLVEGSVRKSGDRLRVTARLVRASNGEVAWSRDWDSRSADSLKLQDEVAAEVAMALQKTWQADR